MSNLKTPLLALTIFASIAYLAAFTQSAVKQPDTASQEPSYTVSDLVPQTQNFVFFFTKTFASRARTQVTIPYSYDGNPPILFVGFTPADQENRRAYLFSQPQLTNLNWSQLKESELTLFQKNTTYSSITDFLKHPPSVDKIALDPGIPNIPDSIKKATSTETELDLNQIDYILTTYLPPTEKNGVYYYQNIIDASSAQLNQENEIEWFIKAPLADQNHPYKLGNVKVDYLQ